MSRKILTSQGDIRDLAIWVLSDGRDRKNRRGMGTQINGKPVVQDSFGQLSSSGVYWTRALGEVIGKRIWKLDLNMST